MSDTKFVVRRGVSDDVTDIAAFNIDMARETENKVLPKDIITHGASNLVSHPERGFYLVVETEAGNEINKIVASLMVTTEWSDWRNGNFWWIQSVYVLPDWRRMGLYRLMYKEVKRLSLEATDVCGFRLYVEKENAIAQQTYRSLGMEKTHYLMFEETLS